MKIICQTVIACQDSKLNPRQDAPTFLLQHCPSSSDLQPMRESFRPLICTMVGATPSNLASFHATTCNTRHSPPLPLSSSQPRLLPNDAENPSYQLSPVKVQILDYSFERPPLMPTSRESLGESGWDFTHRCNYSLIAPFQPCPPVCLSQSGEGFPTPAPRSRI